MDKNILHYIDSEKVNTLLEGFNKSTGFVTAILDLEGNILSKSGWRHICTKFHRVHPETAKRCRSSDTILANKMTQGGKYQFYHCLNGLVDVAVPIVIDGKHVANLFSGQFLFEKPDIAFFEKQAAHFGFDPQSYIKAIKAIPIVSHKKVHTAMDFLLFMTEMISEMTFQKLKLMEQNEELKKNEAALHESEEKYRILFNTQTDSLLILNDDSPALIVDCNPATQAIFGYSKQELIGADTSMLFIDHQQLIRFKSAVSESIKKEGRLNHFPFQMKRKNGSIFPSEHAVLKLESEISEKSGWIYIIRDLTEKKNLKKESFRFKKWNPSGTLPAVLPTILTTS